MTTPKKDTVKLENVDGGETIDVTRDQLADLLGIEDDDEEAQREIMEGFFGFDRKES